MREGNRLIAISTSIANIPIKKMQVNNRRLQRRRRRLCVCGGGIHYIIIITCWHSFTRHIIIICIVYAAAVHVRGRIIAAESEEGGKEHWNERSLVRTTDYNHLPLHSLPPPPSLSLLVWLGLHLVCLRRTGQTTLIITVWCSDVDSLSLALVVLVSSLVGRGTFEE